MLKNFTLIFFIALFFTVSSYGQSQPVSSPNTPVKFIKFYPNPAVTFINFEFQKGYDKNYSFLVFNFLGKKVIDLQQPNPRSQVDLTNFTRGVYIFQLKDKNGKVIESGKFQVEK
jgi:hypothetical protein